MQYSDYMMSDGINLWIAGVTASVYKTCDSVGAHVVIQSFQGADFLVDSHPELLILSDSRREIEGDHLAVIGNPVIVNQAELQQVVAIGERDAHHAASKSYDQAISRRTVFIVDEHDILQAPG